MSCVSSKYDQCISAYFTIHVTAKNQPKKNSVANLILFLADFRPAEFLYRRIFGGTKFFGGGRRIRRLRGLHKNYPYIISRIVEALTVIYQNLSIAKKSNTSADNVK